MKTISMSVLAALLLCSPLLSAEPDLDITNYQHYSDILASAGQPSAEQIRRAADNGFKRVIDLSFNGANKGIEREDAIVIDSGMRFIQLPVNWRSPSPADFTTFAAIMQSEPDTKTLVHCQLNYRATAFSFLYRVAVLGIEPTEAEKDMLDIWTPNNTWSEFLSETLAGYGIDYRCTACEQ
ncbi:MAG: protein tyrosine phosphatase family protein [Pseudomonadota bacterium]